MKTLKIKFRAFDIQHYWYCANLSYIIYYSLILRKITMSSINSGAIHASSTHLL